jgi:hypothetical protein
MEHLPVRTTIQVLYRFPERQSAVNKTWRSQGTRCWTRKRFRVAELFGYVMKRSLKASATASRALKSNFFRLST